MICNFSEVDHDEHSHLSPLPLLVQIALWLLDAGMMALALGGNVLIALAFAKDSHLRSARCVFVVNLATADILIGVFCLGVSSHILFNDLWILGHTFCVVFTVIERVSCFESALMMVMLGLDSALIVKLGVHYSTKLSTSRAVVVAVGTWMLSIVFYVPPIMYWEQVSIERPHRFESSCYPSFAASLPFMAVVASVELLVPLVSCIAFSYVVYTGVRKSSAPKEGDQASEISQTDWTDSTVSTDFGNIYSEPYREYGIRIPKAKRRSLNNRSSPGISPQTTGQTAESLLKRSSSEDLSPAKRYRRVSGDSRESADSLSKIRGHLREKALKRDKPRLPAIKEASRFHFPQIVITVLEAAKSPTSAPSMADSSKSEVYDALKKKEKEPEAHLKTRRSESKVTGTKVPEVPPNKPQIDLEEEDEDEETAQSCFPKIRTMSLISLKHDTDLSHATNRDAINITRDHYSKRPSTSRKESPEKLAKDGQTDRRVSAQGRLSDSRLSVPGRLNPAEVTVQDGLKDSEEGDGQMLSKDTPVLTPTTRRVSLERNLPQIGTSMLQSELSSQKKDNIGADAPPLSGVDATPGTLTQGLKPVLKVNPSLGSYSFDEAGSRISSASAAKSVQFGHSMSEKGEDCPDCHRLNEERLNRLLHESSSIPKQSDTELAETSTSASARSSHGSSSSNQPQHTKNPLHQTSSQVILCARHAGLASQTSPLKSEEVRKSLSVSFTGIDEGDTNETRERQEDLQRDAALSEGVVNPDEKTPQLSLAGLPSGLLEPHLWALSSESLGSGERRGRRNRQVSPGGSEANSLCPSNSRISQPVGSKLQKSHGWTLLSKEVQMATWKKKGSFVFRKTARRSVESIASGAAGEAAEMDSKKSFSPSPFQRHSLSLPIHSEDRVPTSSRQLAERRSAESVTSDVRRHVGTLKKRFNTSRVLASKVAKSTFIVVLLFLVTWTPYLVATAVDSLSFYNCKSDLLHPYVIEALRWLRYSKSSLNPFLYAFAMHRFKKNLCTILGDMLNKFRRIHWRN